MSLHVTVLIPAFNTASFISLAIESCLKQSYTDFDILVVDDGSTDQTYKVVEPYLPGKRVSLIRWVHNRGLPFALNYGITMANGPILTFLGSDDTLLPNSLAIGIPPFEQDPKLGFLYTNFRKTNGGRGWSQHLPQGETLWSAIVKRGWWRACAQQFFRKDTYMQAPYNLDCRYRYAVDYQLAIIYGETGCNTRHIPVVTYVYRSPRPGSMSTSHRTEQKKCDQEIRKMALERIGTSGERKCQFRMDTARF